MLPSTSICSACAAMLHEVPVTLSAASPIDTPGRRARNRSIGWQFFGIDTETHVFSLGTRATHALLRSSFSLEDMEIDRARQTPRAHDKQSWAKAERARRRRDLNSPRTPREHPSSCQRLQLTLQLVNYLGSATNIRFMGVMSRGMAAKSA